MRIVAVGSSHSSAPLPVLERLSIPPGELESVLERVREIAAEAFILSTCNRTEIYAVTADPGRYAPMLLDCLAARAGYSAQELRQFSYVYANEDAVRHALRVASGLDAMVLGEDQIQSQMKRALGAARGAEMLGATLERLGASALGCGKRVRTFTGIGHHSVSLESLAVDAAAGHVGTFDSQHVVVLGSGSSAAIVLKQLRDANTHVTVVGRTHGPAAALAAEAGVGCETWERLPEVLASARVVFCCTSAPHPVLSVDMLERRVASGGKQPLLCVDLGMPRDVDESAAALPGVAVISLAELATVAARHREARRAHVPAAAAIVDRETDRFLDWLRTRRVAGAIAGVRERAEAIADAEVKRALARLQTASAHDRAVVGDLARRIVRQLMHEETHALKAQPEMDAPVEREEAS